MHALKFTPGVFGGGRVLGGEKGRRLVVAAVATSTAAVVTFAPSVIIEQSVRLVSAVHPLVAVSVERVEVGWRHRRPEVQDVKVVDKRTKAVLFESGRIHSTDASLLDILFRRVGELNVFVDKPRVVGYDVAREPLTIRATPFSGECAVDGWMHVFVSDGEVLVDETVGRLLNGRVFVDVVKTGSNVRLETSAPGCSLRGAFEQQRNSVRFVTPLEATAELNQAFLGSFLGTVNPLVSQAVGVGGGRVSLSMRPTNDVLSLDSRRPVSIEVEMGGYSMRVRQGALIDDVLKILNLRNERELVVQSSPARVLVSIDGGGARQRVETVIDTVSLILADSKRVDVGVSTVMEGTTADFSTGDATLEMSIDIQPQTLRDVMKIRSKKPLRIGVRGSSRRPKVLAKDALVRLGVLVVDSML